MTKWIPLSALLVIFASQATEHRVRGLLDLRFSVSDSIESYVNGGYGKFRFNDGNQLSLAQGTLIYNADWENNLSVHIVANAYMDNINDAIGLTEAYLQYKRLPSPQGFRFQLKAGMIYPKVSMENITTGWSSPYTLSYSTINSWIGEEVRHNGFEASLTRLGKISGHKHDITVSAALFQGNDPTGAMLAWHGWVQSSRQSLRHEKLPLPELEPRFVPDASDPFLELDNRTGYHLSANWRWHSKARLLAGYYDNNADPTVVENGQWAWETRFAHLGVKWQFTDNLELIAQYLQGDTLMKSGRSGNDLVYNDYHSAYVMLSKKWRQQRLTVRIEEFSVTDNDEINADNNQENGEAATINYSYRLGKHWWMQIEYNWIHSDRPSRIYQGASRRLTEQQGQFAVRYFF